jgi:hypothetical protein
MNGMADELITEGWLASCGFKWHQLECQDQKQWLLWIGSAIEYDRVDTEDLGIELCINFDYHDKVIRDWFCWLRSDYSHRYSRFIHIRHMRFQREVIRLVEGVTGQDWHPENHRYGYAMTAERALRQRQEDERLDIRLLKSRTAWQETEKDNTRGHALPEHIQGAIDGGKAK